MADKPNIEGQETVRKSALEAAAMLGGQQSLEQASKAEQGENVKKEFAEGIGISDQSLHQMEEGIKKFEADGWEFEEIEAEDGTFSVMAKKGTGEIAGGGGNANVLDAWAMCLSSIESYNE